MSFIVGCPLGKCKVPPSNVISRYDLKYGVYVNYEDRRLRIQDIYPRSPNRAASP